MQDQNQPTNPSDTTTPGVTPPESANETPVVPVTDPSPTPTPPVTNTVPSPTAMPAASQVGTTPNPAQDAPKPRKTLLIVLIAGVILLAIGAAATLLLTMG